MATRADILSDARKRVALLIFRVPRAKGVYPEDARLFLEEVALEYLGRQPVAGRYQKVHCGGSRKIFRMPVSIGSRSRKRR